MRRFLVFVLFVGILLTFGCSQTPALPLEEQRLLAFGAVLAEKNELGYTHLFGRDEAFTEECRKALAESWKITDAQSADTVLRWLINEGMRAQSEEFYNADELLAIAGGQNSVDDDSAKQLAPVVESYNNCAKALIEKFAYTQEEINAVTTTAAWDYDRAVTLARWCYGCGYLTEDQTWAIILLAEQSAQQSYSSWKEYFAGVQFGRTLSIGGGLTDPGIAEKLFYGLDSPYVRFAFAR